MMRSLLLTLLLLATALATAGDVQPLLAGSTGKILAARSGKPFMLAFWSIGCAHCPQELRALGELQRRYPQLDLVLVSTDTPADATEIAATARGYGLAGNEQWVFAEDVPERLRAEIDSNWHGELPRTYLYDREHRVEAVSGVIPAKRLARWARDNAR